MINFDFERECTGCGACTDICPVKAITMKQGKDRFLYPVIDKDKCISCGKCDAVCPHLTAEERIKGRDCHTWLYASGDSDAKLRSSSGAAFYKLAEYVIKNGGGSYRLCMERRYGGGSYIC